VFRDFSSEVKNYVAENNSLFVPLMTTNKGETLVVNVNGRDVTFSSEYFKVKSKLPEGWTVQDGNHVRCFVNWSSDDSLVNEGFAREVVRHVQLMRKTMNLVKTDKIGLFVTCSDKNLLKEFDSNYGNLFKERAGVANLEFTNMDFVPENFSEKEEFQVKNVSFKLFVVNLKNKL